MAGPTGDSIRALHREGAEAARQPLLADPLLDGKAPAELKANLADLKNAAKLIELIADKGVIVAAEVREPAPTLKGVGAALGGLLGGKLPGPEALMPDAQVLVDRAGRRARRPKCCSRHASGSLMKQAESQDRAVRGRRAQGLPHGHAPNGGPPVPIHAAWWVEGKHFVFYAGTCKPDGGDRARWPRTPRRAASPATRCSSGARKTGEFESVTRGFVDTAQVVTLAKSLAGPFVPGFKERLDDLGLGGLKAVVFASGFDGKESRALYEFDVPGERKGLAQGAEEQPLGLNDLPPMPPDVSRFSALRLDPAATYDAGLGVVEVAHHDARLRRGGGRAKNAAETIKAPQRVPRAGDRQVPRHHRDRRSAPAPGRQGRRVPEPDRRAVRCSARWCACR